jgi:hypothetical protein
MPIHHDTYVMQTHNPKETIHMLQRSSHHQLKKINTHKAHPKEPKEHTTQELRLNTCTRAKKNTKLTLNMRYGKEQNTSSDSQSHSLQSQKTTYLDHSCDAPGFRPG